jgi:hypothetical protein
MGTILPRARLKTGLRRAFRQVRYALFVKQAASAEEHVRR